MHATPSAAYATNAARSAVGVVSHPALATRSGNPLASAPARAEQRARQVVAGEERRAVLRLGGGREQRLLRRQEERHVALRRVQRAGERDQQDRPEAGREREAEARRDHHRRRHEQHAARREAAADETDAERERRRAEQRRGHDRAGLEGREAEPFEVPDQHHAREAVGEAAQRARRDEPRLVTAHHAARVRKALAADGRSPSATGRRAAARRRGPGSCGRRPRSPRSLRAA